MGSKYHFPAFQFHHWIVKKIAPYPNMATLFRLAPVGRVLKTPPHGLALPTRAPPPPPIAPHRTMRRGARPNTTRKPSRKPNGQGNNKRNGKRAPTASLNAPITRTALTDSSLLLGKVSAALTALGFIASKEGVAHFFTTLGGGGGGGGFGGNAGDLAAKLAEYIFFPTEGSLAMNCLPCVRACEHVVNRFRVKVNPGRAARAAESVVKTMDSILAKHSYPSITQLIHRGLVGYVNGKLRDGGVKLVRLRWILPTSAVLTGSSTRVIRLAILKYVFRNYVDYYLPVQNAYNLKFLERKLFNDHKKEVIAFLKDRRGDISPIVRVLVHHLVEFNDAHVKIPNAVCGLCHSKAMSCIQKSSVALSIAAAVDLSNSFRRKVGRKTHNIRPR